MGTHNGGPRAVLYARVSKATKGGHTVSVDDQLAELRRLAERHGATVAAEVADRGVSASGSAKARPGWREVLRMVAAAEVEVVALWEVSRSSRRLAEWASFRDLCRDNGVRWLTPDAGFVEPYSSRDRLSLGVKAVVAEEEAEQTSQRIKRAVRERAAEGRPHGRDVYGYRRVYDPASGRLTGVVVEPDEAAVVRRVAAGVLNGRALRAVARELNAEGLPCPSDAVAARRGRPVKGHTWTTRVIADMLRRKTYAGVRVHRERDRFAGRVTGEAEHAAVWPAILTLQQHERLVALLNDPARNTRPDNLPGVRHWLSGVLRCGKCGARMRHSSNTRRDGSTSSEYYLCGDARCRGAGVNAPGVEALVAEVAVARLSMPDAAPALVPGDDPALAEARDTLAGSQQRLQDLAEAYALGAVSLAAFTAAEGLLRGRVDAARATLDGMLAPAAELPEWAQGLGGGAADAWRSWGAEQRHAVASALFDRILVKPLGRTGRPRRSGPAVPPERLGFQRAGTSEVVWGVPEAG